MIPGTAVRRVWAALLALVSIGGRTMLALALLVFVVQDLHAWRVIRRGVESGLAAEQPPLMAPRLGINVALERYGGQQEMRGVLQSLRAMGYGTLRQRLPWAELEPAPGEFHWQPWDEILEVCRMEGFQVILVLDDAPAWARSAAEQANPFAPPEDLAAYARYAGAVAQRYGGQVLAYQIWDQPNIHPHWGRGEVDPAGYVAMLAAAAPAIRAADPGALIVAGGLAPNTESGGRNLSDVQYLREMYRRGAGQWFDVLGVKAYGFWSGPYDRRVSPEVLNFSRAVLLREEMVRRGDAHKPVWALDGGWVALPPDWQGRSSPLGTDAPHVQAQRLRAAVQRVQREWPWMTLFVALHLQPNVPEDDPLWGLSLFDADGRTSPLFTHWQALGPFEALYHPGLHLLRESFAQPPIDQRLDLSFWGSDLAVWLERGRAQGELQVEGGLTASVPLEGSFPGIERVWLIRQRPLDPHTLQLVGTPEQLAAVRAVQVGNRVLPWRLWLQSAVGLVLCGWLLAGLYLEVRGWPLKRVWRAVQQAAARLPTLSWAGGLALLLLGGLTAPNASLRLALLACYGLGALLYPEVALLYALAAIPLAPVHVSLGPGRFAVSEVALLLAAAARLGHALLAGDALAGARNRGRLGGLDVLVGVYVLWGAVSAGLAEYQRVAWREFRLVIAEPALLYALLRLGPRDWRTWRTRLEVLLASAAAVALYALAVYPTAAGVIRAEGVRRARAFYGSPNNLALYLERLLPLGVAMGLWGAGRRRWLYAAAAIGIALAIALTYSRGAWLLGVPAGLVAVAWLRGGRARRSALAAMVVGGVALALVLRMPRFSSLMDLTQGTPFLRVQLWRSAWEMARDHPWLGVGPDNFLYYYGDYIRPGAEVDRWLSHPHNLLLDFWLRLGLPGLALLGATAGTALLRGLRALWHAHGQERPVLIGLLGGLAAAGAHGLIDAAWFVPELAYWGMFVLAWIATLPRQRTARLAGSPADELMAHAPLS